jgi:hypothetical protein
MVYNDADLPSEVHMGPAAYHFMSLAVGYFSVFTKLILRYYASVKFNVSFFENKKTV